MRRERLASLVERIIARCELRPGPLDTPCRVWLGAKSSGRYGVIKAEGQTLYVQRVVLAHKLGGSIPPGLVAGHSCDCSTCTAEDHLEPLTWSQNVRDSWARLRRLRPRTLVTV